MLKQGDIVQIIAPSGKCSNAELDGAIAFIESVGLVPRVSLDIFSDDLHCSNSAEYRFDDLKKALYADDSKAIWCIRGGYGTAQLYNDLINLEKPEQEKLIIGFSDITFLHIFVNQKWGWQSLHAPVLSQSVTDLVAKDSFDKTIDVLFGRVNNFIFEDVIQLNNVGELSIEGKICGGNLTLVQNSIGTGWQIDCNDKFLLLEEVGECAYKVDRLLLQLTQANILQKAKAIFFGDFACQGEEEKIQQTLQIFADNINIPVFKIANIGHGKRNYPLFFNKNFQLKFKNNKWILGQVKQNLHDLVK